MRKITPIIVLLLLIYGNKQAFTQSSILYVGTFSERESKGIYVYEFDLQTGDTKLLQTLDHLKSPSFLTLHPNQRFLYSANRETIVEGKPWGSVSSFSIDPSSGELKPMNDASSLAEGACYLAPDHSGKQLFVANYAGGSMAAYGLNPDGEIGELQGNFPYQIEGGPIAHAHAAVPSPDNRYLFVPDLGNDEVVGYRIKPKRGKLKQLERSTLTFKKGVGPRHFVFHPSKRYAFVAEELTSSVSVLRYRKGGGTLTHLQRESTLPEGFEGKTKVADIRIHPNGKWLYVSNRGHNSLAIFEVDPISGAISAAGHEPTQGDFPRGFMITENGKFLLVANRNSDNIVIFEINPNTGQLKDTGKKILMPSPVSLAMRRGNK